MATKFRIALAYETRSLDQTIHQLAWSVRLRNPSGSEAHLGLRTLKSWKGLKREELLKPKGGNSGRNECRNKEKYNLEGILDRWGSHLWDVVNLSVFAQHPLTHSFWVSECSPFSAAPPNMAGTLVALPGMLFPREPYGLFTQPSDSNVTSSGRPSLATFQTSRPHSQFPFPAQNLKLNWSPSFIPTLPPHHHQQRSASIPT